MIDIFNNWCLQMERIEAKLVFYYWISGYVIWTVDPKIYFEK